MTGKPACGKSRVIVMAPATLSFPEGRRAAAAEDSRLIGMGMKPDLFAMSVESRGFSIYEL